MGFSGSPQALEWFRAFAVDFIHAVVHYTCCCVEHYTKEVLHGFSLGH